MRRCVPVSLSPCGAGGEGRGEGGELAAETIDLSTSGACLRLSRGASLPPELELRLDAPEPLRLRARLAWHERVGREERAGLAFEGISAEARRALVRVAFSADGAHAGAHEGRARTQVGMAARLLAGLVRAFLPLRTRRRRSPRARALRPLTLVGSRGRARALQLDRGAGGLGLLLLGAPPPRGTELPLLTRERVVWTRVAHARRLAPGLWRAGLVYLPAPLAAPEAGAYLAA